MILFHEPNLLYLVTKVDDDQIGTQRGISVTMSFTVKRLHKLPTTYYFARNEEIGPQLYVYL